PASSPGPPVCVTGGRGAPRAMPGIAAADARPASPSGRPPISASTPPKGAATQAPGERVPTAYVMAKKERAYCTGIRDEVWRGKDPRKCPKTATCAGCGREKSVTAVEEGDEWAAFIPVHPLPSI